MECSPSTPTMNSYFYKFMINLLKRFSSERKLLEVRGAFIIRSVPGASLLPRPRVSSSRGARGRGSRGLSAPPVCDGCRRREKPGEEAEKRGLRGRKTPGREGDTGSLEGQEAGRSLLSAAGNGQGVKGKETGEPQGGVATLGVVKGLILRRGGRAKNRTAQSLPVGKDHTGLPGGGGCRRPLLS